MNNISDGCNEHHAKILTQLSRKLFILRKCRRTTGSLNKNLAFVNTSVDIQTWKMWDFEYSTSNCQKLNSQKRDQDSELLHINCRLVLVIFTPYPRVERFLLEIRREFNSNAQKFKATQNKTLGKKKQAHPYLLNQGPDFTIKYCYLNEKSKHLTPPTLTNCWTL